MIDLKLVLDLVKIGHLSQEVSSLPDIQYLLETLKPQGHRIRCHSIEWNKITDKLPINDIIGLAKGLTIMESNFDDWFNGSVSPIIWIFRTVQGKNERMGNDLVDWILPRTRNPYVPFGSQNYGARSLAEYHQKNLLHKEMIRRGIADIKDNEEKTKRDREIRRSQRLISAEDRVTGKRKLFLNELNQMNITDQLIRLSEDNKYSAKYYPTRCVRRANRKVIESLDDKTRLAILAKLKGKHRGPWGKFKRRLVETFNDDQRGRLIPWDRRPWC
jgi:hypothetical protein